MIQETNTQKTPENMGDVLDTAAKTITAQPKYEKRGKVKFNSPVETSKTGKVFDGDLDFSRLSPRGLKAFRKMVREQARIYAKEYEMGERAKDKAEFQKVRTLMHSVIEKANRTKRRSVFLSIGFGFLAIIELGLILAITLAPRQ